MSLVLTIVAYELEDLEGVPAVVDEDLRLQIGLFVGIHDEASRLRQAINSSWMSVERTALLHLTKADGARCFIRVIVVESLIDTSILRVEICQGLDHIISHRTVEPEGLTASARSTHPLKVFLNSPNVAL